MEEETDVGAVREYFTTRRQQNERKHNLTEEMGQTLADFVEKTELNKTAVGIAGRLDRLSADKRNDVLRSLDAIRAAMEGVWAQEATAEMDFDKKPDGHSVMPEPGVVGEVMDNVVGIAAAQQAERARRRPAKATKAAETIDA